MKLDKPLGSFIFEQIRDFGTEIEEKLSILSTRGEEWAINVDYNFSLSPEKKIRDHFLVTAIPYIDDARQGTYRFKFKSIETIFLNEICEVIYRIILDRDRAERIISSAKVTIEYIDFTPKKSEEA